MTESILVFVILAQSIFIAFLEWNNRKERKTMLNAILSQKSDEVINKMTSLELTDKTQVNINNTEAPPEYTEVSASSDELFDKVTGNSET